MTQQLWVPGDTRTSLSGTALPRPPGKVRGLLSGLGQKPHPLRVGNKAKSHGGKKSQGKPTDVKRRSRENLVPFCAVGPRAPGVEHGERDRGGLRAGRSLLGTFPPGTATQSTAEPGQLRGSLTASCAAEVTVSGTSSPLLTSRTPCLQHNSLPPPPAVPKSRFLSRFPARDEAQAAGAWHGRQRHPPSSSVTSLQTEPLERGREEETEKAEPPRPRCPPVPGSGSC